MTNDSHDAQRDMEQRALRNVRALVDKIENTDDHNRKAVRSSAIRIVAVVVAAVAILAVALWATHKPEPPHTVVLPPPGGGAPK